MQDDSEESRCTCPGPTTSSASARRIRSADARAGQPAVAARSRPARREPATCRSCRSTRASSIPPGASFAPNPAYFDPENIVKLAIEGGCNARGVDARRARRRWRASTRTRFRSCSSSTTTSSCPIPNSVRSDPLRERQAGVRHGRGRRRRDDLFRFGRVEAADSGSHRDVPAGARARHVHRCCGATCGTRRSRPKEADYHVAADLTGQANHLGVTIEADIIKQKLPENNGGFTALNFGKTHKKVYSELTTRPSDRPDALSGRQLLHGPRRADQLRRRVGGRKRPEGSGEDRGDQQARRRHGPDFRPRRRSSARSKEGVGC